MGKQLILNFLFLSLICFALPLYAKEEPNKAEHKETEKKQDEKKEKQAETKEEKPTKADKQDEQERLLNPKRFRIRDVSISRFGTEKVFSLVTYNFAITTKSATLAQTAYEKIPKIRAYILEALTEVLSNNPKMLHNGPIIRKVVSKQVEKVIGPKTVNRVEITESFERKL